MDNKSKNQGIPTFTPPEDGAPVFTPPKTPQHDGPVCYHHPSEPAVARCARCGKYICNSSNNLSNSNEKLLKLIEDGSGFGIHFVISSLEYQTVKDCMHYGENSLAKFPERIIFSLNDNDADNLVENVSVTGLRDNTVYFTDGVKDTYQMKPYIAPTAMELEHFLSSLN